MQKKSKLTKLSPMNLQITFKIIEKDHFTPINKAIVMCREGQKVNILC